MTFDDLKFNPVGIGIQARHTFSNGYGVSVIMSPYSYGGNKGLYELAVLKNDKICYDTPITNDVEGYLTKDNVTSLLKQVEAL